MSWKKALSILIAGTLLGVPLYASADNDRDGRGDKAHAKKKAEKAAAYEAQLITRYTVLAGSVDNATALVRGLHNGTTITLTELVTTTTTTPGNVCPGGRIQPGCGQPVTTTTTTLVPTDIPLPTKAMKYKQVKITLWYMETKLKNQDPNLIKATPAQIKDALVGDTGILTMRAKHMSWRQIARKQGFTFVKHEGDSKYRDGKHYDLEDDDDDD